MGKHIVTIGGGSGHSELLAALRDEDVQISAIVSMTDNGGSSGRLRQEHDMPPPGDVRKCLSALATTPAEGEDNWEHRFTDGDNAGHPVGNLFLLGEYKRTGSLQQAADAGAELLGVKGEVLVVTEDNTHIEATLEDGTVVTGEEAIDVPEHDSSLRIESLALTQPATTTDRVREAIAKADMIVLSMGDLYTSIIPNLLIEGVTQALAASNAPIVYVCNRSTKSGETSGFSTQQYVDVLNAYLEPAQVTDIIVDTGDVALPEGVEGVAHMGITGGIRVHEVDLADENTPATVSGAKAVTALKQLF